MRRKLITYALVMATGLGGLVFSDVLEAAVGADYIRFTSLEAHRPSALATDAKENLYVVETEANRLRVFAKSGEHINSLVGLSKPSCVAVDANSRILIGSIGRKSVDVYDKSLKLAFSLGKGKGEFSQPTGIAIAANGDIYVVDAKLNKVKVFGPEGSSKFSFGNSGANDGQFHFPTAIAINPMNNDVVVSDLQVTEGQMGAFEGARVQIFNAAGVYKASFGEYGVDDGLLTKPVAIAITEDGTIFLADAYQNVIQVFTSNGDSLGTVYDPAYPVRSPLGLAVGPGAKRLFVAAADSGRVEIYGLKAVKPKTVTVKAGAGGRINPVGTNLVASGGSLAMSMTPDPGYEVSQLLVDGVNVDTAPKYTLTNINANHTVQASFAVPKIIHWVNVNVDGDGAVVSNPTGIVCSENCSGGFKQGTEVTISAIPDDGSVFTGWQGACSGSGDCTLTMDGPKSAIAVFRHLQSVKVAVTGEGAVGSYPDGLNCPGTCSSNFSEGSMVSLSPWWNEGMVFMGWEGDCTGFGSCDLVMDEPKNVTATFMEAALVEGFETGALIGLPWRTGGDAGWTVQNGVKYGGQYAAASAAGWNYIEVPLVISETGAVSFVHKANGSAVLRFLVDGVVAGTWNDTSWAEAQVTLANGSHILRWEAEGSGTTYLDNIIFPPYAAPPYPIPDLKANDLDGPLVLSSGDELSITYALALGGNDLQGDWWLLMKGQRGWMVYNQSANTWQRGLKPSGQGDLPGSVLHQEIFKGADLAEGDYTFVFLLDTVANGRLDQPYVYDVITVTISND